MTVLARLALGPRHRSHISCNRHILQIAQHAECRSKASLAKTTAMSGGERKVPSRIQSAYIRRESALTNTEPLLRVLDTAGEKAHAEDED